MLVPLLLSLVVAAGAPGQERILPPASAHPSPRVEPSATPAPRVEARTRRDDRGDQHAEARPWRRGHVRAFPGFHVEGRVGSSIVSKLGVPNAVRAGVGFGPTFLRTGPLDLSLNALPCLGSSEQIGHSYRLGAEIEGDLKLPRIPLSLYLSAGGHYFRSVAEETRSGALWRAAFGLRVLGKGHLYAAIEPLAIERLPDGPGPYTPLRSRWAYEITFLIVGWRP